MALDKCDPSARFVELIECGHVFEVSVLDTYMDMDNAGATAVKLKQCPECSSPIRRTLRYSNIVKTKLQQIEEVKKRVIGFQKVKRGNDMLKVKKYLAARQEFMEGLSSNPGLLEAHLGQACALCGLRADTEAIPHLSFIIEQSTYKKIMMAKLPRLGLKSDSTNKNLDSKIADNELAIDALLQRVLICSLQNDLATGLAICDLILRRNPGHEKTAEIKGDLIFVYHVKRHVIDVKGKEMGERGHWYKCQNDHFYVVGECRGAMQTSECPDCKAVLERMSHSSENSDADATGNRWCSVM